MSVPAEILAAVKADVAPNRFPKLTDPEISQIIIDSTRFNAWQPSAAYLPGSLVVPSIRSGVIWQSQGQGTSGTQEPDWVLITDPGYYFWIQDNDLWWKAVGSDNDPSVYDLRRAKYDCWIRKAGYASGLFSYNAGDAGSAQPQTVADQCAKQARRFRPLTFR
jgi:hypothetical protein